MKKRFLLDGVIVGRTDLGVDEGVIGSTAVLPHPTVAPLPIVHNTLARTEQALHLLVLQFFIVESLMKR